MVGGGVIHQSDYTPYLSIELYATECDNVPYLGFAYGISAYMSVVLKS